MQAAPHAPELSRLHALARRAAEAPAQVVVAAPAHGNPPDVAGVEAVLVLRSATICGGLGGHPSSAHVDML